jgi:deferrochelatase/peroxidase EfeB
MGGATLTGRVSAIDFRDVQALARFGFGKLVEAAYLLLRIRDAAAARAWIAAAPVTSAEYRDPPPDTALQIAFTPAGLRALGLTASTVEGFSPEFLGGMAGEANRSRRLGDAGKSDPTSWLWGGPDKGAHLAVMLFAKANLEEWKRQVTQAPWESAFEVTATLSTSDMGDHEPFGFRDGISQPEFDWERQRTAPGTTLAYDNSVALGELLLGYPNEYGKYTERPLLDSAQDPAGDLAPAEDHPAQKDLGLNGTYFVLRQLEQDVRGFWQYLAGVSGDGNERHQLGAALVGRTVEGDPLIPETAQNAFTYDGDPAGVQCPLGAHIRRANPRNADLFGHPSGVVAKLGSLLAIPRPAFRDDLVASTRFHRVLRRGREYGSYLSPEDALQPAPDGEPPRGLHFACLVANISRQFEFVQNAWLMSTKFNGLTEESDPLLGNREAVGDCPVTGNFSIPRDGRVPRRLTGMPQFVTVRGGEYFFLPSLRALRYIARGGKTGSPR